MSKENVETFKRGLDAYNRRDLDELVQLLDPEVEFHAVLQVALGGEAATYRGHEGVREMVRDVSEVFTKIEIEISEIRDLGDRLIGTGRIRAWGSESGVEVASPYGVVVEFKDGKPVRSTDYLDPEEALKAAAGP